MATPQLSIHLDQSLALPRPVLEGHINFETRASPIPSTLRLSWRLALLTLTLRLCCRRYQSSIGRLQVFNWAVRSPGGRSTLLAALEGHKRPEDVIVRYEPAFTRVLSFSTAEGLLYAPIEKRLKLTAAGEALAQEVLEQEDCFVSEKLFLLTLGQRVTEEWITRLISVTVSA
jgi:hypothetical protein